MPLVEISLIKGKSREYIRSIVDGVHQAVAAPAPTTTLAKADCEGVSESINPLPSF